MMSGVPSASARLFAVSSIQNPRFSSVFAVSQEGASHQEHRAGSHSASHGSSRFESIRSRSAECTAKALSLTIPDKLLALADEVIE
jgi:hypothetical protein